MELTEKTLKEEYIFKGKIISVRCDEVELPNGHTSTREVVEHSGGVCVLPLTDKDEVIFVRQFRYPYKEVVLEIPAGKRDHGAESPLECGKRELKEEVGAEAAQYTTLGELYPSPGYCGEIIYMYLATELSYGVATPDEDEFLHIEKIPFSQALNMVLSGEIKDAKTQTALLKAAILLKKLPQ